MRTWTWHGRPAGRHPKETRSGCYNMLVLRHQYSMRRNENSSELSSTVQSSPFCAQTSFVPCQQNTQLMCLCMTQRMPTLSLLSTGMRQTCKCTSADGLFTATIADNCSQIIFNMTHCELQAPVNILINYYYYNHCQGGYVFVAVCSCLLATMRKNFWTDLYEIFREGWQWVSEQMIKFRWRFGSPYGYRDCFLDLPLLGDRESG